MDWTGLRHPNVWLCAERRRRTGRRYLRGTGLEIGALHNPFPAPRASRVTYVDRLTTPELRDEYPELRDLPLADVEVVDDGETLGTVGDGSVDFVVASHFIEHTEDPIGTLKSHLRVLREGGHLLLAVPDRRRTFDRGRPATPFAHLVADHEEGPERSRAAHYREWVQVVQPDRDPAELERQGYRIHFHCWTRGELAAQVRAAIDRYALPARVVRRWPNGHEFLLVLRRTA